MPCTHVLQRGDFALHLAARHGKLAIVQRMEAVGEDLQHRNTVRGVLQMDTCSFNINLCNYNMFCYCAIIRREKDIDAY